LCRPCFYAILVRDKIMAVLSSPADDRGVEGCYCRREERIKWLSIEMKTCCPMGRTR